MKRIGSMLMIVLIMTITTVLVGAACTHILSLTVDPNDCEKAKVEGSYYASDNGNTIKAILYVDDVQVDEEVITTGGSTHTAYVSWSGTLSAGSHTAKVEGYRQEIDQPGYWDTIPRPYTPAVYDCELTTYIHGTTYDVSDFYNKPTGDDNHCHRIVWGDLSMGVQDTFKAMHHNDEDYSLPNHGTWVAGYNYHITQNPTAHEVSPMEWLACPEGYDVYKTSQCRDYVDPTYKWVLTKTRTKSFDIVACHEYSIIYDQQFDCSGGSRNIDLYDFGVFVENLHHDEIVWQNIYQLETGLPAYDYAIPAEFGGGAVHFDAFDEPIECLVTLKHEWILTIGNTCEGWSSSFSSSDGGIAIATTPESGFWSDPYSLESATVGYEAVWPDGFSTSVGYTINEPEECLRFHTGDITWTSTCGPLGTTYTFTFGEGIEKVELTNGVQNLIVYDGGSVLLSEDGWKMSIIPLPDYDLTGEGVIYLYPEVCLDCDWEPTGRHVWVLLDDRSDVPTGHFRVEGIPTCMIITDGSIPNVGKQAQWCECGGPVDFTWVTTDSVHLVEMRNSCTGQLALWNPDEGSFDSFWSQYYGWDPMCSPDECPPR